MDQGQGPPKSNIARPLSRLPLARASAQIHQDEPAKQSHLPRASVSNTKRPVIKPLGESNNAPAKTSFGFRSRLNGLISPTSAALPSIDQTSLDTTPPNAKAELAVVDSDNENATITIASKEQSTKRKPRLSLSERTIETLSQISPAPSPTRRRSTVNSNGSMGPPARPASAMKLSRANTPSIPIPDRPSSPTKRNIRACGKPATPNKSHSTAPSMDSIYTPPKAFMRDHSSRIGRPARNDRRSISNAVNINKDGQPALKPSKSATKVKSMYDLRAAASRGLSSKPSMPSLADDPNTPPTMERKPSWTASVTGLMKARSPGENVLASKPTASKGPSKMPAPGKRGMKRAPIPQGAQSHELSISSTAKSSVALRETIAKAKAAKREELRKSSTNVPGEAEDWSDQHSMSSAPILSMGVQSMRKKLQNAITSGSLNLSAMSFKELPEEVLTMYDFREDNDIAWAEAVDLVKLILADNELTTLPESAFPDWTVDELEADPDKSNQFGGLEVLDLHNNSLNSLPVGIRRLQQLQTLNLAGNTFNITIFSTLSELCNLKELRLAKNGLHGDLPTEAFSMLDLQVLDLSDNELDVLPSSIANMHNLQKLWLGGNRFSSIPLRVLPSEHLIELDLSRNMLGSSFDTEPLQRFEKLQFLDLSFNNLECISAKFFNMPALQTLSLQNNRIDTLPNMSSCTQLTTLAASNNGLTSIPDGFYSLNKLRNVDFSGNKIRSIGAEIVEMESLAGFNVSGNPLREKRYLTMNVDEIKTIMARRDAANETIVSSTATPVAMAEDSAAQPNAQATQVSALLKPKAGVLDLSSRGLSSLSPDQVDLAQPVHTLRLANNDFTTFPVELLLHPSVKWSLRSLDISHNLSLHPTNYLSSEVHLPLLQSLYIVSTGLTTLDTLTEFLRAPELKELNISCHRLSGHIPWVKAWFPTLTTLLASDNWFDSIDVEAVRGLEVLDVRNNEIEHLPPKIGLLGNHAGKVEAGSLRSFEATGNRFRVPRLLILEKGTEAVLRDLRRMVPAGEVPEEWAGEV